MAGAVRLLRTREVSSTATTRAIGVALIALWLAGVVFLTLNHEYWRDEVRAWSLARRATSPLDLHALVRHEGHPVLWYLLLAIGTAIVDSPLVLPVTSALVALAAVVLFVWRSPFALGVKALFIFGALPFYVYAVVARNYGVSMLLLFAAAACYRARFTRPLPLAIVLALLANTNVHSAALAGVLTGLWGWDLIRWPESRMRERWGAFVASGVIIGMGFALCVAFVWPPPDSVVVSRAVTAPQLLGAAVSVALHPGKVFAELTPAFVPPWLTSAILLLALAGLAGRPRLALTGFVAMVALGALFIAVYPGSFRHQGLLLVFLVVLYWFALDSARDLAEPRRWLQSVGLYGGMGALLLSALVHTRYFATQELRRPMSSSKVLAAFLEHSGYRDAIIVAEPDYYAESLAFYVPNRIYFPRERRFGTTVMWTTASQARLSLSELIDAAQEVAKRERREVLILLGHREVYRHPSGAVRFPYSKVFSWTDEERQRLAASTLLVADFATADGDENYSAHALLPAAEHDSVLVTPASPRLSLPQRH
jgi:hypothetical protein